MTYRQTVTFLFLGLVSMQATAAIRRPPLTSVPPAVLPIPYNPVVEVIPPIMDVQSRNALSCGCGPVSCGCSPISTVDCRIPTSVSPVFAPACGCGVPSCGCGVPTATYSVPSLPVVKAGCGCGVPTAAYRAPSCPVTETGCGCGVPACGYTVPALTTPLLPPLPPVIGCSKYLRQVCVQPPFL